MAQMWPSARAKKILALAQQNFQKKWSSEIIQFADPWLRVLITLSFYSGNVQLANIIDDEACIMRLTPFVQANSGAYLVKYDPIEEELILNEKGFAIQADYDEPGKKNNKKCE
jgi:hypothetical protein